MIGPRGLSVLIFVGLVAVTGLPATALRDLCVLGLAICLTGGQNQICLTGGQNQRLVMRG